MQSHRTYDPIIRMVFHYIKMCCTSLSFLISCHLSLHPFSDFSPSFSHLPLISSFSKPLPFHMKIYCVILLLSLIVCLPSSSQVNARQSGYRITWIESLLLGQSESDLLCLLPLNKRIDRLESIRLGHPPKMSSTLLTPGTTLDDKMCET